jgi:hypothetical protein
MDGVCWAEEAAWKLAGKWETLICDLGVEGFAWGHRVAWYPTRLGVL